MHFFFSTKLIFFSFCHENMLCFHGKMRKISIWLKKKSAFFVAMRVDPDQTVPLGPV